MDKELKIGLHGFTLDCKDPNELAKFYAKLLNWEIVYSDEDFVVINAEKEKRSVYPGLIFQRNLDYIAPVWPEEPNAQQQMAHIDFEVNDLDSAVKYAIECGARLANDQFSNSWKVMFDPAGHPFCLCKM